MNEEYLSEQLFQALISGNRQAAREAVRGAGEIGMSPEETALQLLWPALETVNRLYRADQLATLAHHYATRLLRSLLDQAQIHFSQRERRNRTICLFSGPSETEELAGQLMADLAEADGYDVHFAGGGVAADEILAEVADRDADILLLFASSPQDAPGIRHLIDTIRGINACPQLQIVVGGGVFARAEGLAEEIGADLWANDPQSIIQKLHTDSDRRATTEQRTVGRNRRISAAA